MKNIDFLINYKYAHRGLHDTLNNIAENSLEALQNALDNHYAIEFDVNITKDNKWVIFHDNNLKRMTNLDLSINKVNYNEIKDLKLVNTTNRIPLLSEGLSLVNGKVPLLIEIKNTKLKHLSSLIEILNSYQGKFALFSFNPKIVGWLKRNHPNIIRGQISSFFDDLKVPKFIKYFHKSMFFNKFNKPDFISYNINNLPNKYVKEARRNNILCLGYTAKNIKQYEFSLSYLDNVVFENFKP